MNLTAVLVAALVLVVFVPLMGAVLILIPTGLGLAIRAAAATPDEPAGE